MTIQDLYTQYLDGKITKQKFLYEARRDQNLTMISPTNSFDDVVKILKNKSIISEKASKESKQPTGKQDVEIIAKTIDMVNPYEYANGMDYELGIIDIPAPDGDLDEGNVLRAQKKVLANLTKNPSYYTKKLYGRVKFDGDKTVEINKKSMDAIGKGKKNVIREGVDKKTLPDFKAWMALYKNNSKAFAVEFQKIGLDPSMPPSLAFNKLTDKQKKEVYSNVAVNAASSKGLKESYEPFPMTEEQKAVLQRYAESTGIAFENLLNMVAEARAKKKAKPDFLDLDKDGDREESMKKAAQDKKIKEHGKDYDRVSDVNADSSPISEAGRRTSIKDLFKALDAYEFSKEQIDNTDFLVGKIDFILYKMFDDVTDNPEELAKRYQDKVNNSSPISEDLDLGHQDNEPRMIKGELYQIAKQATELYKMIDALDNMGEVDFPHWWQAKIVLAKNYLQGAKDYLDSALMVGNEEGEMEEAIALKDKVGNTQYAKDSTEASNIERAAKTKGVILTKTQV